MEGPPRRLSPPRPAPSRLGLVAGAAAGLAVILCLLGVTTAAAAESPRLLVLGLDAVPYDVVAELADPVRGEAALFQGFSGPVPMISSFPSTTNVALSGMVEPLEVDPSMGYEVRFFDRGANRVRGGGPISYHRLEFPWRRRFVHVSGSLLAGMLAKLTPVKASIREVEELLELFLASREEVFFAYVDGTDGAGHLRGPESLVEVMKALDHALAQARRRHPDAPFYTLLFSDHGQAGGEPLVNVRPAVRDSLRAAGFRVINQLVGTRDVAIPELGMVSSFVLYTQPGREEEVTATLAPVPGVELCVCRWQEGLRVESAAGRALIRRREIDGRVEWSYQPEGGDPLGYRPALEHLQQRAGDPDRRWFADSWWLEATAAAPYPDALYRLARAFDLVDNPASVLCSTAPGHLYAAWRTETVANLTVGPLRWTHGSLRAQPTLGFVATDLPGWKLDGPVRFTEVLLPAARWLERGGPGPDQIAGGGN